MKRYFALLLAMIGWTIALPGNMIWEIAGWVHTGETYRVKLVIKRPPLPQPIVLGDGFIMLRANASY